MSSTQWFEKLSDQLDISQKIHLLSVTKGAAPWLGACLATVCRQNRSGPLVWILPDEKSAQQAYTSAQFYLGMQDGSNWDVFTQPVCRFALHQLSPYDDLSPDPIVMAERLALLFRLIHGHAPSLIVTSSQALMRLSISKKSIDSASRLLIEGEQVDQKELKTWLVRAGYLNVPMVEEPARFAVRGFIMDIFSPLLSAPARLEWFGDEIESIRTFDPNSQRTIEHLDELYLGPVREIIQDEQSTRRATREVERRAAELDLASHKVLPYLRRLKEGTRFFGMESLLPAFDQNLDSLFDYLPTDSCFLIHDGGQVIQNSQEVWDKVNNSYQELISSGDLAFEPAEMFLTPEQLKQRLDNSKTIWTGLVHDSMEEFDLSSFTTDSLRREITDIPMEQDPMSPLLDLLKSLKRQGSSCLITSSNQARSEQLAKMLRQRGLAVRVEHDPFRLAWLDSHNPNLFARIVPGDIPAGFTCKHLGVTVISDSEIFGSPTRRARRSLPRRQVMALKPGEYVVHMDFGIGQFRGLVKLQAGDTEADFLLLTYKDGDKLYLPVTGMSRIERYSAPEGFTPALSKLGSKAWERTKQKIHQALFEMADELVRLEAARRAKPGFAMEAPGDEFFALEKSFAFETTLDQQRAIDEVMDDLTSPKATDRLVCGDVGFGKTEVAIRAAYLASLSGKQTMILVPTTVLALQHLATFKARLDPLGAKVSMLSRMASNAEQKKICEDLSAGKLDVVIGTHMLLSPKVQPSNLGLLIIDEEHRFGVKHKEKIKKLRKNVDVLTMTATPLPRTLQMALSGIRDISIIRTPPPGRRSVRTHISKFSKRTIAESIRREKQRGGQVFFVHNFVNSLPAMKLFIERAVPEVRIGIAHGQMGERKLEQVMMDFVRREIDVLLSTSIIESGLDIPSANTVIVNRADRFGLAQLYQIRGRVGRASVGAYAYFLIPGIDSITKDARLRLEALAENTDLGSGYEIASRDLEIRGAGNLLGKAQSGHIKAVGFGLYNRLLERAVMEVKGQTTNDTPDPEISLPVAAYLPEEYIPDLEQRLDMYSRLSRAACPEEVFEMDKELQDRFGTLPPQARSLLELSILKTHLRRARVTKLDMKQGSLRYSVDMESKSMDPKKIIAMVTKDPTIFKLHPEGYLLVELNAQQRKQPLAMATEVARRMAL